MKYSYLSIVNALLLLMLFGSYYVIILALGVFVLFRFLNLRNQRKMQIFKQQQEREEYQSKIDFFTNVAHEIRTPLSLIKAPLDHVLMTEKLPENIEENLQIMSRNTDRLLNLTNQLLDFRKAESDAYMLNLRHLNISELIREMLLHFMPAAKQRKIDFMFDLPEEDMFVQVDKEAFTKIISNLTNNAVKYCDTFVRIKSYILENNGEWQFHFITENDGEIIPVQFRKDIFKPFVHIDKEKVTGTGIGLALALSLAELHNGALFFEDEAGYNRFHLILPVGNAGKKSISKEENRSETEIKINKKTTAGTTILLVDDDKELLHFEEKCLSLHYNILTAENGKQALEILKNNTVNLIVSDVMMPEMDGFELTKHVKSDIELSHIPIILLTAKVNVQSKVQGYETGADAYIDKPFSVEILMARIINLLQNREKLREIFLKHPFIGASSVALTKSDEKFIKKLHTIVQENISNPEFAVNDVAEKLNMSPAGFYRKIKGILDLAPNEYIRIERLKQAAKLLKDKTHRINEICHLVGFTSPSYFARCFQQQFGVLPKEFE
jgi:signal transduction histidine kinase/DNA-binding response OmpR family regulator